MTEKRPAASPGSGRASCTLVALLASLLCFQSQAQDHASTQPANAADATTTPYRLVAATGENRARPLEPYQVEAGYRLPAAQVEPLPPPAPAAAVVRPFEDEVSIAAREAGVEAELVHAVIEVESAYRPGAVSPKGAVGLMQVMPGTAQRYGVTNLASVPDNLRAGSRHLRTLIEMFGHRLDLVLAAYNAGEGAVRKYNNAIPPYRETREYVPAVLKRYKPVALPEPVLKLSNEREYMPGTRLDPAALQLLK